MGNDIRNGYRLRDGVHLLEFTTKLRQVMGPVSDQVGARLLMSSASALVDAADLAGTPRPGDALFRSYLDITEGEDRKSGPNDATRFTVVFGYDAPPLGDGSTLALVHTGCRDLVSAWEAMEEVEPYVYWDKADRDETFSEQEWEARGQAWGRTFGFAAPSVGGLSFTMECLDSPALLEMAVDTHGPMLSVLEAAAPTIRQRSAKVTVQLITEHLARTRPRNADRRAVRALRQCTHAVALQLIDAVGECLATDVTSFVLAPRGSATQDVTRPADLIKARQAVERFCADAAVV